MHNSDKTTQVTKQQQQHSASKTTAKTQRKSAKQQHSVQQQQHAQSKLNSVLMSTTHSVRSVNLKNQCWCTSVIVLSSLI
jgi:hypothetical protein